MPGSGADYPDALLREWAKESLGADRCSSEYFDALRVILGNMARADRHAARLQLTQTVQCGYDQKPFATRQTMRTILGQLVDAGLITKWVYGKSTIYSYEGRSHRDCPSDEHDPLIRLFREAEDADFRRFCKSVGLEVGDAPY